MSTRDRRRSILKGSRNSVGPGTATGASDVTGQLNRENELPGLELTGTLNGLPAAVRRRVSFSNQNQVKEFQKPSPNDVSPVALRPQRSTVLQDANQTKICGFDMEMSFGGELDATYMTNNFQAHGYDQTVYGGDAQLSETYLNMSSRQPNQHISESLRVKYHENTVQNRNKNQVKEFQKPSPNDVIPVTLMSQRSTVLQDANQTKFDGFDMEMSFGGKLDATYMTNNFQAHGYDQTVYGGDAQLSETYLIKSTHQPNQYISENLRVQYQEQNVQHCSNQPVVDELQDVGLIDQNDFSAACLSRKDIQLEIQPHSPNARGQLDRENELSGSELIGSLNGLPLAARRRVSFSNQNQANEFQKPSPNDVSPVTLRSQRSTTLEDANQTKDDGLDMDISFGVDVDATYMTNNFQAHGYDQTVYGGDAQLSQTYLNKSTRQPNQHFSENLRVQYQEQNVQHCTNQSAVDELQDLALINQNDFSAASLSRKDIRLEIQPHSPSKEMTIKKTESRSFRDPFAEVPSNTYHRKNKPQPSKSTLTFGQFGNLKTPKRNKNKTDTLPSSDSFETEKRKQAKTKQIQRHSGCTQTSFAVEPKSSTLVQTSPIVVEEIQHKNVEKLRQVENRKTKPIQRSSGCTQTSFVAEPYSSSVDVQTSPFAFEKVANEEIQHQNIEELIGQEELMMNGTTSHHNFKELIRQEELMMTESNSHQNAEQLRQEEQPMTETNSHQNPEQLRQEEQPMTETNSHHNVEQLRQEEQPMTETNSHQNPEQLRQEEQPMTETNSHHNVEQLRQEEQPITETNSHHNVEQLRQEEQPITETNSHHNVEQLIQEEQPTTETNSRHNVEQLIQEEQPTTETNSRHNVEQLIQEEQPTTTTEINSHHNVKQLRQQEQPTTTKMTKIESLHLNIEQLRQERMNDTNIMHSSPVPIPIQPRKKELKTKHSSSLESIISPELLLFLNKFSNVRTHGIIYSNYTRLLMPELISIEPVVWKEILAKYKNAFGPMFLKAIESGRKITGKQP